MLAPWKKSYDQPRRHIKKQKHYFANKVLSSQSSGFSSSHVWMLELDYKERIECQRSNAFKLWCWRRLWDLEIKAIQPVHPKGNRFWIFTGRTDAEADSPIFWSPDAVTQLKKLWCWERLEAEGEEDNRGWDSWMVSPTQWTWVWINSGSWWWTGRPEVLQSIGSQRVRKDWVTILKWTELFTVSVLRLYSIWFLGLKVSRSMYNLEF